jgi:xanthine dehydrogenase YagT iron-sulfur-binding subunit
MCNSGMQNPENTQIQPVFLTVAGGITGFLGTFSLPGWFKSNAFDRGTDSTSSLKPNGALMPKKPAPPQAGLSRRSFLGSSGAVGAAIGLGSTAANAQQAGPDLAAQDQRKIMLTINGKRRSVTVEPRTTLVEALRDTLGMTGTKIGCNQGQCGACTVLLDGRRINSCLTLAVTADGADVVTVEGLADPGGKLHPMQQAFAEHDAFQCGYCTPGQILSAIACIDEGHATDAAEIREYMSGNLCRCGAYPNIVAAVESVRDSQEG